MSDFENTVGTVQNETQKIEKNNKRSSVSCGTIPSSLLYGQLEFSQESRQKWGQKKITEKIMTKYFPNLMKL